MDSTFYCSLSDSKGRTGDDLVAALIALIKAHGGRLSRDAYECHQVVSPGEEFGELRNGRLARRLAAEKFLDLTHDGLRLTAE